MTSGASGIPGNIQLRRSLALVFPMISLDRVGLVFLLSVLDEVFGRYPVD